MNQRMTNSVAKRAFGAAVVMMAVATLSAGSMGMGLLKDPFAGSWKITARPDGGDGKEFKDTLTFKGDQMTATALKAKGWASGQYEEDTRAAMGGMAPFKATLKNEKLKGEMIWTGKVVSGQIQGEVVIKVEGKPEEKYTFTGER